MKLWPHVRWWAKWLLIFIAVSLPMGFIFVDALPEWAKGALAGAIALVIIRGLDQRRRRRAYEEAERREATHAPGSTCCSPRSRDA